jgi:hypothetical protein
MPLPLIPLIVLGSSAAAGVKGAVDLAMAGVAITKAKQTYDARRATYELAEQRYQRKHKETEDCLQALVWLRLDAVVMLGEVVAFMQKARVKERTFDERVAVPIEQLEHWQGQAAHAVGVLSGVASGAVAGTSTAAGVYGLIGALGTASTGTAIGSLSGIAATNATLAWLGGGALAAGGGGMALGSVVLGGLVAGPALLASGFFVGSKVEAIKTEVARHIAAMDVAEAEMARRTAKLRVIRLRINEVIEATQQALVAVRNALATADAANIENVYLVARLAKGLADLLDVPVVEVVTSQQS